MAVESPRRVKSSSILLPHSPLNHIPFTHSFAARPDEWAVCVGLACMGWWDYRNSFVLAL